jgi:type IX secretion system PorP/SprF family membrane protein
VNLPIAKKFEIGYSTLTIGVSPGLISQTQRFDQLRFVDPSDPLNVGTRQTNVDFNLGAGIVYRGRSGLTTAASVNNLTEPGFDYGLDTLDFQNSLLRSYSLLTGYTFFLTRDINLNPNVQVRSDFNSFTFDVGLMANYRERGWAGLSYRWEEAMTLLIGYSFLEDNKLKVGYAFDYVINEREAKQPTSQEFYIRYDLPDLLFGGRKQVKTPRFTY